ncbi:EAL domain, c-di-GMP-specific phosphodiesterase class I (or its enzymatically inactive variant) [Micromonospora pattaloongensis]|uniref:EAL domain, c-di-GMP-specific phosphodiesterase class I (Or its enzymatically inactive variant) n=1 Tax=Micromonospora pattaloongensis TaxID=405436 RepID=A0A1H3MZ00_9ACTN|nr:EAL domain-containing protein [Micromonospora pattaloongensis]SDY81921.1 EAL domain, c-di-GMP-specific phosphodiesterase class I (or its enzymatically inactive variant) [Micromonospora pattaloongensis]
MVVLFQRRFAPGDDGADLTIEELVRGRMVATQFQPVVRLDTREVVGYEALVRGPAGTAFETPAQMFAAAEAAGLTWELDLVAVASAFTAAVEAGLPPQMSLFINVDPTTLGRPLPDDLARALVGAHGRFKVFLEFSEQALLDDPHATVASIDKARASGWGVSLDHIGVAPPALALMPFARPDVTKIDVSLVHRDTHPHAAQVMNAVTAHAERTKASILAVGIESEGQLRTARSLGAVLGQGYLFGAPGALPPTSSPPANPLPLIEPLPPAKFAETPFRLATAAEPALPASESMLAALAAHLERRVAADPDPIMFLACLPGNKLLSGAPLTELESVTAGASYAGVLLRRPPGQRIRGVHLAAMERDDPLQDELCVILIGPHYAALLAAQERLPGRPAGGYEYRLLYDRMTVARAARVILHRIRAAGH